MAEERCRLWHALPSLLLAAALIGACARGSATLGGWRAMQPGVELTLEQGKGPQGEDALALLYTMATGQEYGIEHDMPMSGLAGRPGLSLQARATRVLHLAIVIVASDGAEYECARTLRPDGWQELVFNSFPAEAPEWSGVSRLWLVDRTAALGSQGPVSLKLVGLPGVS